MVLNGYEQSTFSFTLCNFFLNEKKYCQSGNSTQQFYNFAVIHTNAKAELFENYYTTNKLYKILENLSKFFLTQKITIFSLIKRCVTKNEKVIKRKSQSF